jgi:uncharacterized protein (TIGR02996 family)
MDDPAFLAAITAAPQDAALRLVYADWLEEQGDPRAELVRIEEEMRQLPVFSDRYWQLKPRRNTLRVKAPEDWLGVMRYGTDCLPLFQNGVPDDWKERWRLIREFVDRWHRRDLPDVGGRTDEIRQTEDRLGRTLPPSVREWVAFAHDVRRNPRFHEVLRDVYQMQELDGFSAVSLLLQGEGDYHWAVRHLDLTVPDPPVYGFHWDVENHSETFVADARNPVASNVTSFVLGYAMDCTHGTVGGFSTTVADPGKLIRDLESAFPVRSQFGEMQLFEADNILVRLFKSSPPWMSGVRLEVKEAKRLPRSAIPAFLRLYMRSGGSLYGAVDEGTIPF